MRTSGWLFLITVWTLLTLWTVFCFWRVLRPKRRQGHETPTTSL